MKNRASLPTKALTKRQHLVTFSVDSRRETEVWHSTNKGHRDNIHRHTRTFHFDLRYRILAFSSPYGTLIILSGPSCVGKGPLHTAFNNFYPERAANLQKLVLYNCRSPRPGESDGKDYYFRSREEIDGFREKKNLVVLDVRGDLQAIDLNDVERALSAGDLFFEGNPVVGRGFYNRRNC